MDHMGYYGPEGVILPETSAGYVHMYNWGKSGVYLWVMYEGRSESLYSLAIILAIMLQSS